MKPIKIIAFALERDGKVIDAETVLNGLRVPILRFRKKDIKDLVEYSLYPKPKIIPVVITIAEAKKKERKK